MTARVQSRVNMHIVQSLGELGTLIAGIASMITSGAAIFGVVKFARWTKSRTSLVRELEAKDATIESLNAQIDIYKETNEALQRRFDSIDGRLDEVRTEMTERYQHLEKKWSASTEFICAMIIWGREHPNTATPMPRIPDEIATEIYAALQRVGHAAVLEKLYGEDDA